jgi:hypothetical protein
MDQVLISCCGKGYAECKIRVFRAIFRVSVWPVEAQANGFRAVQKRSEPFILKNSFPLKSGTYNRFCLIFTKIKSLKVKQNGAGAV